jgi:WD40 repeat protein
VNKLSLDRGAHRALAASDDGTIKVIDIETFSKIGELAGHDAAVQCVTMSPNDGFVVSGSSDSTFKIWSK